MFQDLIYSPEIRNDLNLLHQVERASNSLAVRAGDSAKRMKVRWDKRIDDQSHDLIRLTMQDWKGEVHADFTPDELGSHHDRFRRRLRHLYLDLLFNRSRILVDEMMKSNVSGEPE